MPVEYRVQWSRSDQKHGPRREARLCEDLEDAEAVARHQITIDQDGVDGLRVANPLTVQPYIERRFTSGWMPVTRQEQGS